MLLPEPPNLFDYPAPDKSLLDWLRSRIDDSMLQEIAAADYGLLEKKHLRALRKIRDTGVIPSPLPWEPSEVLHLISFSEPDDSTWRPGRFGESGHLMRAFCCAVLLQNIQNGSHNYAIVQLTASVLTLGREVSAVALHFLWSSLLTDAEDMDERSFFAFAILLLCASKYQLVSDEQVRKTAEWVIQEAAERKRKWEIRFSKADHQWILDLTYESTTRDTWRRLTREILLALPRENKETAKILRDIGRQIVDGSAAEATVE